MSKKPMGVLIEAHDLINGERLQEYGNPHDCCSSIAAQWALYLQQKHEVLVDLTPEDVCWMMSDFKKVRQMSSSKRDNIRDAAGYIGLIEKVWVLKK